MRLDRPFEGSNSRKARRCSSFLPPSDAPAFSNTISSTLNFPSPLCLDFSFAFWWRLRRVRPPRLSTVLSKLADTIGLSKLWKVPILSAQNLAAEPALDLCVGPSVAFKVDIAGLGNAGDSRRAWLGWVVYYRAIGSLGESSSSDFSGGSVSRTTV